METPPASFLSPADPNAPGVAADAITERILNAALEEFELVGIRRSNVVDITRRAGISRATLYRRFGDKDRLVAAVAGREVARALAEIETEVAKAEGPEDTVVTLAVVTLRAIREHTLLNRLLATEPEEVFGYAMTSGAAILALGRAFVSRHVEGLQALGELPAGDPAIAAEILTRLSISLVLNPEGEIPLDDDQRVSEFAREYLVPIVTGRASQRSGS